MSDVAASIDPEGRRDTIVRLETDTGPDAGRYVRSVVRRCFDSVGRDAGNGYLTAVTEVFVNAVDEHRRLEIDAPIVVEIDVHHHRGPTVSVIDCGDGIDLEEQLSAVRPDEDRGRGLLVATIFVPSLRVDRLDGRTVVRLPLDERS